MVGGLTSNSNEYDNYELDLTAPTPALPHAPAPCSGRTWTHTPSGHVKSFNNRQLTGVTVEECKSACCAETAFTCRSFDYYIGLSMCDLSEYTGEMVGGLTSNSNEYD